MYSPNGSGYDEAYTDFLKLQKTLIRKSSENSVIIKNDFLFIDK